MYYCKSLLLLLYVCFKSHFSVLLQNIANRRTHFDSKTFLNCIMKEIEEAVTIVEKIITVLTYVGLTIDLNAVIVED